MNETTTQLGTSDPTLALLEQKRREAEDMINEIPDAGMRQMMLDNIRVFYDLLVRRHLRGVYDPSR